MSRRRKRKSTLLYVILGIILTVLAVFMIFILMGQNEIDKAQKYRIEHNLKKLGSYSVDEVIDNYLNYSQKIFTLEGIVGEIREDSNFYLVDVANEEEIRNNRNYKVNYDRAIKIILTNRLSELPKLNIPLKR